MGTNLAVVSAFVVEGLTKVINLLGVVNPGNLGTYEAGEDSRDTAMREVGLCPHRAAG